MKCPKCNKTIYLGTYHRVQQLKIREKDPNPIATSYMIHDPNAPIDERVMIIDGMEFQPGYDGVFGKVKAEKEEVKKEIVKEKVKEKQSSFV